MSIHEENLGFLHKNLARGKDKNDTFLKQREFYLEIKNSQKSQNVTSDKTEEPVYNTISNDIWFHISKHIAPEDVQTFGLICRQTAALVRSKAIWKRLYKCHCQTFKCKLHLPAHLQFNVIRSYNYANFRTSVIEALFHCYPPLISRVNEAYSLNLLLGRIFISAWHRSWENCMWIMCYQFRQQSFVQKSSNVKDDDSTMVDPNDIVNDWESLVIAERKENYSTHSINDAASPYEGVCLLVIFGQRFIPFPKQLTYGNLNEESTNLRLTATRRPLTSDMRDYNLELDFTDTISRINTTVKYPTVKFIVLPWWHPDFRKYVKYEACDKFS